MSEADEQVEYTPELVARIDARRVEVRDAIALALHEVDCACGFRKHPPSTLRSMGYDDMAAAAMRTLLESDRFQALVTEDWEYQRHVAEAES